MIPADAVRMTATPEELGLDSLGLVEAIFAIEEAFDIAVPFNANDTGENRFDMRTVGLVVDAVRGLVAAKSA
jgi:acyl carrier protein